MSTSVGYGYPEFKQLTCLFGQDNCFESKNVKTSVYIIAQQNIVSLFLSCSYSKSDSGIKKLQLIIEGLKFIYSFFQHIFLLKSIAFHGLWTWIYEYELPQFSKFICHWSDTLSVCYIQITHCCCCMLSWILHEPW